MTKEEVHRLMLVDDNTTDRFIHRKLLQIYGLGEQIIEHDSGRSALTFLRENRGAAEKLPQVILLDVLMPEMNGFEFLTHLENFYNQLSLKPVIFMLSSTDDERDLRRARNSHIVQKMLRKPFAPEALAHALKKV